MLFRSEHFNSDGEMDLNNDTNRAGSAEGAADGLTEIRFRTERVQMHIHADIDPPGGEHEGEAYASARLAVTNEAGDVLFSSSEHVEEMLVLPAGTYTFSMHIRGEATSTGDAHARAFIHYHFDVDFQPPPPCTADFNGDTQVDFFDYLDFAQAFSNEEAAADFNHDGQVDFFDYLDFAQAFSDEDPRADFDQNGQIDFFDYLDFAQAFDAGCD